MGLYFSEVNVKEILQIGQKLLDGVPFSELFSNQLFDESNIYLFWKDSKSRFLGCNNKLATIAGFNQIQQIVGKNDYELPWHKKTDKFIADDHAVISLLCPKLNIVESVLRADGNETTNLTNKFLICSSNRKKYGVFGIMTDITVADT